MTTEKFFFSIVVPALNEEKNLPRLFESLQNQSIKVPHQIIISDNGSTDSTIEVAKKLGAQVATGSNKGYIGSARFVGAELAEKLAKNFPHQEEIIIFTDADSWLDKNYFQTICEAYQNPKVVASMGPVVFEQGKYSFKVGKFIHPVCLTSAAADLRAWWILKYIPKSATLFGCNTAIRRHIYNQIGGYDPNVKVVEDLDLALKILSRGMTVSYLPKQIVHTSARKYLTPSGRIDPSRIIKYYFNHDDGLIPAMKDLRRKYQGLSTNTYE